MALKSSGEYGSGYEAYIPILQGIAGMGDTSSLKDRMQQKADYNSGILKGIADSNEKQRQVNASYDWANNPQLQGLSLNDRERLRQGALAAPRSEEQFLGAYYTARQEDLASAISAWKEAWQAKYNAAKEGAEGQRNLWGMASDAEKQAESIRQFNEQMSETKRHNKASEGISRAGLAQKDAPAQPSMADYITRFIQYDKLKWGNAAKKLSALGYDVSGGSVADRLLREGYMGKNNIGTWDGSQWVK